MIMLLRYPGKERGNKSVKLELFNATQWKHNPKWKNGEWAAVRYRIRAHGKWFKNNDKYGNERKYFTWYEVRDLIWSSFKGPGKTPLQTRVKHKQ